jgi:hypothetical protein
MVRTFRAFEKNKKVSGVGPGVGHFNLHPNL